MNKLKSASNIKKNEIEILLAKIQPLPGEQFHKKMAQAPWRRPSTVSNAQLRAAVVMILIVIVILTITPQGRAWAQEVVQFFTRVTADTVQLSDETIQQMNEPMQEYDLTLIPVLIPEVPLEMQAITGCETLQKAESYRCQVDLAESTLGFDLKELPEKPIDWEFNSLSFDPDAHMAGIRYEFDFTETSYSTLVIKQGTGYFPDSGNNPWESVPVEKVETVSIGGYPGEYVKGRFGLSPGNDKLTWSDHDVHRLAWREDTIWYWIEFWPNLNLVPEIGRDELIHMAESLIFSPVETMEGLNPDRLSSIVDAEKISGLDLKSPTLLPMNMDFSYARYSSDDQKVDLIYGSNEELIIQAWEGAPVDFKKPLGKYEFTCEVVSIRNGNAYYCARETPSPHSFLWWYQDGLNYQMDYEQLLGGRLGREKMIAIAESLK